jgi:hypothetical protein
MKKAILSLIYAILLIGIVCILYLFILSSINSSLYGYKSARYSKELDSLFKHQINVEYFYKSGDRGSVYYLTIDSSTNLSIIETSNFKNIVINDIAISGIENIKLSQNKTYFSLFEAPFSAIQIALNPRKSTYLNVFLKKPFQIEKKIKSDKYCFLKGNFSAVVFGNKQNCSIISFRNNHDNEILILKYNSKLYFFIQSVSESSLLGMVNPSLL